MSLMSCLLKRLRSLEKDEKMSKSIFIILTDCFIIFKCIFNSETVRYEIFNGARWAHCLVLTWWLVSITKPGT